MQTREGVATGSQGTLDETDERPYWILLTLVSGVGPARFGRLLATCGGARAAWQAPDRQLALAGLDARAVQSLQKLRARTGPQAVMEQLARLGVHVVLLGDAEYPASLLATSDPPPVLYLRGAMREEDAAAVAFVGTRRATSYGRSVVEKLAGEVAEAGITIVSGLARGVDTLAHRAALEAGGRTIAVLGNGLDQVYPPENAGLARRIAEGRGAVVSEFGPGVPPDAANFPRRNRIISGLSLATVIVEAGIKSGALITADFALEQGRDVLVVPGSILAATSEGTNELLKQGATPVTSAQDILDVLGAGAELITAMAQPLPSLSEEEEGVLAALSDTPAHLDEIVRGLGRGAGEVSAALTLLELKGLARQVGGMAYIRALSR